MDKENFFKVLAIFSLILSVSVWIPNIIFHVASPFWLITFILAPVGILAAALIKNYWLIVSNTLMLFSFFILMFTGYIVNYITDGKHYLQSF
ncbi:hypothetical protein Q9251_18190 [Alkalihalobacillus macyae]|uniref:hypothetical protein n=1 Tax=Guptibacillus hwajinpoensis TaxID=208199 RepID=UPI00273B97CC|nr:hypothetical protein [Alkalihalobacillus macyae]MDP4552813.1 hypothetical protein [Alkalihalobacillus macyae]